MRVHALHTVHALPDLRVAGGRLGDGVSEDRAEGFQARVSPLGSIQLRGSSGRNSIKRQRVNCQVEAPDFTRTLEVGATEASNC